MMKKPFLLFVLALLLALGCVACAQAEAPRSVDVIMILDCSGSMGGTDGNDPNKLMGKSAMNFIDMCDISGSRVALIPFSTVNKQTENVRDFQDVSNLNVRNSLRRILLHLAYGSNTDAGRAFDKAREFYERRSDTSRQAIVLFFSDGKINLGKGVDIQPSAQKVADVVAFFKAEGVPIYCIGLNGTADFDNAWLDHIAQETGTGYARIVTATNSDQLHVTFREIMAEYLGTVPLAMDDNLSSDSDTRRVNIVIPNQSILEANINLSIVHPGPSSEIYNVVLYKPDGTVVVPRTSGTPQLGDVVIGDNGVYYNVKMIRPEMGTWVLVYDATQLEQVDAQMITNYDIGVRFQPIGTPRKNQPLTLRAEFYALNGDAYGDQYLYVDSILSSVAATFGGQALGDLRFTARPEELCFTATIDKLEVGEYTVQLFINGDGIVCSTDPLAFTVENHVPVRTGEDPGKISLGVNGFLYRPTNDTYTLNLMDYFADEDGDPLSFTVSRNGLSSQAVDVRIAGGVLSVQFHDVAEGSLNISASDGEADAVRTLTLQFSVVSLFQQTLIEIILGAVALIVIAVICAVIHKKRRPRFGRLAYMETAYTGFEFSTPPVSQINLSRYDAGSASIYRVLDDAGSTGSDAITGVSNELGGILLKPAKHNAIRVYNNLRDGALVQVDVDTNPIARGQYKEINIGNTIRLSFAMDNRYITMTYQNEVELGEDSEY